MRMIVNDKSFSSFVLRVRKSKEEEGKMKTLIENLKIYGGNE